MRFHFISKQREGKQKTKREREKKEMKQERTLPESSEHEVGRVRGVWKDEEGFLPHLLPQVVYMTGEMEVKRCDM